MAIVYLRHHHRHVLGAAVGRVIGDDGETFGGVFLFQRQDGFLIHLHRRKDYPAFTDGFRHVAGVLDDDITIFFGDIIVHMPASGHRLGVFFARGIRRRRQVRHLEPRMAT